RFDEIFFIDLPTPHERANILAIQLTRHHRDYREFDLAAHVPATEGFSGAELEQVIVSALYQAFAEGDQTSVGDRHVRAGIASTVPLSRSMSDKITQLRAHAADKWRSASMTEDNAATAALIADAVPVPKKKRRLFDV